MYLAAYHFTGNSTDLASKYDAVNTTGMYRPAFHVVVKTDEGLTIYDTCPSREVFESFSTDPQFLGTLTAAGLPTPRIVALGEVHATVPAPV